MTKHIPAIGSLLRDARKARKFSLETVATYTNVPLTYLSDVESGKRPPPKYHILLRLGMFLGLNEREMMWSAARYYTDRVKLDKIKGDKNEKAEDNEEAG